MYDSAIECGPEDGKSRKVIRRVRGHPQVPFNSEYDPLLLSRGTVVKFDGYMKVKV